MTKKEPTFQNLVSQGEDLLDSGDPVRTDSEYSYWVSNVRRWLDKNYPNTGVSVEWAGLGSPLLVIGNSYYDYPDNWTHFKRLVNSRLSWLGKTVRELSKENNVGKGNEIKETKVFNNKIFIVHGHNEAIRETTARVIEKLGLEPIILHEQPNSGLTIIEKFESHSVVAFAVVLLSGDDVGSIRDRNSSELRLRARQNVIFELGYFIGKLGRNRVCAIYQQGVELPSDYSGILYIPYDESGSWKYQLAKEIKEAGIEIDLNKLL